MSRRADRLFLIVQILRGRRCVTAAQLAERLSVSERTIYRDIQDLSLSGVPVHGEAGCGYRLLPGFELPPLMLTPLEVEATVAALCMVRTWSGEQMGQAADSTREKLLAILSAQRRLVAERSRILAPDLGQNAASRRWFDIIHTATGCQQVLEIVYCDGKGRDTRREVCPLGLAFWGMHWLLVSWCELRDDYRSFRLDRCRSVSLVGRHFQERPDRSLQDFLRLQNSLREAQLALPAEND